MKSFAAATIATALILSVQTSAQWLNHRTARIPRTADGKPNLSARAPRTSDGKSDLSGIWQAEPDPKGNPTGLEIVENYVLPRHFVSITADLKPEEVALQPWADAVFKRRGENLGKDDPISRCQPTGVPALTTIPSPFKIIQMPQLVAVLYEENLVFRQIFTDGRQVPPNPQPTWMGYSVGRWEGDTLVVDTTGFNDRSWLDRAGHPHSEALRVVERFRRSDFGHIDNQITIDDPKAYTKPFTYTLRLVLQPDTELLEYFCADNERDVAHLR